LRTRTGAPQKLVADLALDNAALNDVLPKTGERRPVVHYLKAEWRLRECRARRAGISWPLDGPVQAEAERGSGAERAAAGAGRGEAAREPHNAGERQRADNDLDEHSQRLEFRYPDIANPDGFAFPYGDADEDTNANTLPDGRRPRPPPVPDGSA
jgi:hypothetical protein